MDIALNVDKLISIATTFNQLKVVGALHNGELKADVDFTTQTGGRSASKVVFKTSGGQGELQARLNARDLRLKIMSAGPENTKDIPVTDLTIDMKSTGNSPHALAANSNGKVLITMGPGLMDNNLLKNISGDILSQLLTALNPFVKQKRQSRFDCGVVALNVEGGKSTIDTLLIQDENVMIVAGGNIDLNTEKLNIEFNTKPRTGVGLSADMFVTPFVALRGTLASPSVGLNKSGTLLTLGAAVATGGLSMALQGGMDRVTGATDQCSVILPKYPHPPLADN